jgi:hypothetical protein
MDTNTAVRTASVFADERSRTDRIGASLRNFSSRGTEEFRLGDS